MAQGVATASENSLRMIEETTAGTYNSGASPIIASDIETDFQEQIDFATHRPEGYNADLWHAAIRRWAEVSGPIKPDYRQLRKWFRAVFGAGTENTVSGVLTSEYTLPETGRRNIKTHTYEYGTPAAARRMAYGVVSSLSLSSARAGDTDGNVSVFMRMPVLDEDGAIDLVAMTGGDSLALLEPKPVLPGHWTVYRAADLDALDLLDTTGAMDSVEQHSITLGDLVNPHWVEDGEMTFANHVDQVPSVEISFSMAVDETGDCEEIFQNSVQEPAVAEWFEFRAMAADGENELRIAVYASASQVAQYGEDNNVWRRDFSLRRVLNPAEGTSFRVILATN